MKKDKIKYILNEYLITFLSMITILCLMFTVSPFARMMRTCVAQFVTNIFVILSLLYKQGLVGNVLDFYIDSVKKEKRIKNFYADIGVLALALNILSGCVSYNTYMFFADVMQVMKISICVFCICSGKNKRTNEEVNHIGKTVKNMLLKENVNLNKIRENEEKENKENNLNNISKYTEELKKIDDRIDFLYVEEYGEDSNDDLDVEFYEKQYASSRQAEIDDLFEIKKEIEEKRNIYIYNENAKQIIKNCDYKNNNIGKILDDNISNRDLLNRELKAKSIAEYINNINGYYNIGIIGEWGIGKSTFIQMVKNNLINIRNGKNIKVIDYDASSYSEKSQIWANLAKILFEEFEKEKNFSNFMYVYTKIKQSKKKYFSSLIVNVIILIMLFIITDLGVRYWTKEEIEKQLIAYGCSIIGGLLLITQIVIPWGKKLLSISIPLSEKVIGSFELPSYVDVLGTREEIAGEMDILLKAWCHKKEEKIVVFVDELDRCSEKGIREFFQAIQLFYNTKKIIFVFAIQLSHLVNAIGNNEKTNNTDIIKQYLDKYISILVKLDNKNIMKSDYAMKLIREINAENKMQIESKEIDSIIKCLDIIQDEALTPRKIKKLINLLVLSKSFCIDKYREERINYSQLFIWIIMYNFEAKATNWLSGLYNEKEAHSTMNNMMRNLSNKKELDKLISNHNFIDLIEEFRMCDIVKYNYIAQEFEILM